MFDTVLQIHLQETCWQLMLFLLQDLLTLAPDAEELLKAFTLDIKGMKPGWRRWFGDFVVWPDLSLRKRPSRDFLFFSGFLSKSK